jgi:hypothetical protein
MQAKSVLKVLLPFVILGGLVCVPFQLFTIIVSIPAAKQTVKQFLSCTICKYNCHDNNDGNSVYDKSTTNYSNIEIFYSNVFLPATTTPTTEIWQTHS